jgi:hypothetical protein
MSVNRRATNWTYAQEEPTQYVDFVEICFTGQTDFIVAEYSVTSYSISSKNRFYFQRK